MHIYRGKKKNLGEKSSIEDHLPRDALSRNYDLLLWKGMTSDKKERHVTKLKMTQRGLHHSVM